MTQASNSQELLWSTAFEWTGVVPRVMTLSLALGVSRIWERSGFWQDTTRAVGVFPHVSLLQGRSATLSAPLPPHSSQMKGTALCVLWLNDLLSQICVPPRIKAQTVAAASLLGPNIFQYGMKIRTDNIKEPESGQTSAV